jgi:O-methyltransferase involved in polyketide biosynthesis
LNLGAGLDTRPYRMTLPATLRWVEVDFPHVVEFKNVTLVEHQSACTLERVGMDLLDRPSRNKCLAHYCATSKNMLVITEGVLSYLSTYEVATLARELHVNPSIRFWIQDFDNAGQRRIQREWATKLKAAPILFQVTDWFGFFEKYGWQASQVITSLEESRRINRPYPLDFPLGFILRALPKEMREKIQSLSGAVLMKSAPHPRPWSPRYEAGTAPPCFIGDRG